MCPHAHKHTHAHSLAPPPPAVSLDNNSSDDSGCLSRVDEGNQSCVLSLEGEDADSSDVWKAPFRLDLKICHVRSGTLKYPAIWFQTFSLTYKTKILIRFSRMCQIPKPFQDFHELWKHWWGGKCRKCRKVTASAINREKNWSFAELKQEKTLSPHSHTSSPCGCFCSLHLGVSSVQLWNISVSDVLTQLLSGVSDIHEIPWPSLLSFVLLSASEILPTSLQHLFTSITPPSLQLITPLEGWVSKEYTDICLCQAGGWNWSERTSMSGVSLSCREGGFKKGQTDAAVSQSRPDVTSSRDKVRRTLTVKTLRQKGRCKRIN